MPTAKVCLWNIQNYGTGTDADYYGANSGLRNQFIRDFVREQQVDVLMIQEASVNSAASLQDLVAKLNAGPPPGGADWVVSFCGCALARGAPDPPAVRFDLGFRTDGRSEGYAVAWRANQVKRFTMVPGLNAIDAGTWANAAPVPASPLNLVTRGRPAGEVEVPRQDRKRKRGRDAPVEIRFQATGGYSPDDEFPHRRGEPMIAWPQLEFPTTGLRNPRQLEWEMVRRPAYVVVDLHGDGGARGERLCPVAVYHAPSNKTQAAWGAMMAALSRELYVTHTLDGGGAPDPAGLTYATRTVLGGDFNYEPPEWPGDYKYFIGVMSSQDESGAACGTAPSQRPPALRKTTVQLAKGALHDDPITTDDLKDYLFYAIDLAFFRDASTTGKLVNVPDLIMRNPNNYAATLRAFHAHLGDRANNLQPNEQLAVTGIRKRANARAPYKAMYTSNYGNTFKSWADLLKDLNDECMSNARRAAEFYTIFISDHLPLVVQLTY